MKQQIIRIRRRNGRLAKFNQEKITTAIYQAVTAVSEEDGKLSQKLSNQVVKIINRRFREKVLTVEDVQNIVEEVLIRADLTEIAKAYILYREQRRKIRESIKVTNESLGMVDQYLKEVDWEVKENANMTYSLQGLNNYISNGVTKRYWLERVYPLEIREAAEKGDFHIHDLGILSPYCVGWNLQDLLLKGFTGVSGKISSKPAKHFRSALGQLINFFYTLQGEAAGAIAVSSFDTLLAPFIRYDKLNYKQVKQAIQEFMFNCNVPTRVGFQCMSEDTEILTKNGWKNYRQVKKGSIIATFNIEKGFIEYLSVNNVFTKKYKGIMYNLKNRISDQLISPEHRVVRKMFNSESYTLEKIEKILSLKSPFMVPVGSEGNILGNDQLNENIVKLIAWLIAEGTIDKSGRGSGRISIYQSKEKNSEGYKEIISLCRNLNLKYTERIQKGLGADCNVIRFDANSTRKILKYFNSSKNKGIKFIPDSILNSDVETSRLFLETYIKGDGHEGCKITTTEEAIKDGLLQVTVNAGYGATVLVRKPDNDLSKKDRYIIRLIKHKDTYINKVKKVNYQGIIWCPNTDNETVVAKRNGKIFITGNTPFTNVTLDLIPPKSLAELPVIIGGKSQKEKYGDFQKEIDLFNKAFYEIIIQGDANQRVFTFPIPTINITKNFDWDNPNHQPIWEATAKYGINYFSNFINSELDPDDIRSMCCRLRLSNKELYHRGGGLFGSAPLTGSVGVVTINMPRIGYLSKNEKEFFERLGNLMDLAKESLEIKRKTLEAFTEKNLYPYSKFYLSEIKKMRGTYWANHFSTIGLIGMNEALMNFMEEKIFSDKGIEFTKKVLDFMRKKLVEYQKETGNIYNLEATPAEGTSYRLAKQDKDLYPKIITAGKDTTYYTNSTQLPVDYTEDMFEALEKQDELQIRYTGGTVFHSFLGEKIYDTEVVKNLIKKIFTKFKLPYFTLTPTFSICPNHGYLSGEHFKCPECGEDAEVYSRVVGYLRPIKQWNKGKQEEYKQRKDFVVKKNR